MPMHTPTPTPDAHTHALALALALAPSLSGLHRIALPHPIVVVACAVSEQRSRAPFIVPRVLWSCVALHKLSHCS
jgi:hypothetical protein